MIYDVAIIGGGPAGATLARLIGRDYRVLLLDKRELGEGREKISPEKCCGGLVAPDAQKMLARLGLGIPQDVLAGPQIFTVRTIDLQNSLEKYYQRFYINIDRERFDRWLVSLIPSGVDIRCGALFLSCEREDGQVKIHYLNKNRKRTERARILVGADGASSKIRRLLLPRHPLPPSYIAIQEWYRAENPLPYFSAVFDAAVTDFYSWVIPKEEFLIVGSALSPRDGTLHKFNYLKSRLAPLGFRMDKMVKRNGAFLFRPSSAGQICIGEGNLALVGEAAGWISPSSAEGLSYCFRSALALAQGLLRKPDDFLDQYANNTASLRRNIILKNLKSPFMYNPFLRKWVMKSGLNSLSIIPGPLVP